MLRSKFCYTAIRSRSTSYYTTKVSDLYLLRVKNNRKIKKYNNWVVNKCFKTLYNKTFFKNLWIKNGLKPRKDLFSFFWKIFNFSKKWKQIILFPSLRLQLGNQQENGTLLCSLYNFKTAFLAFYTEGVPRAYVLYIKRDKILLMGCNWFLCQSQYFSIYGFQYLKILEQCSVFTRFSIYWLRIHFSI